MIAKFPQPQRRVAAISAPLALLTDEAAAEHEESLAWVRWLFQSVRARCTALVFPEARPHLDRPALLEDWQHYIDQVWLPILAPTMIDAWRSVSEDVKTSLLPFNGRLHTMLTKEQSERSVVAGEMLLHGTRGARYQGQLGRLRQEVDQEHVEPHLAIVWVSVAVLFQLPLADLLSEYLREEWLTALRECATHAEPAGPLSFGALAHRSMRESGFGAGFQVAVTQGA